MPGSRHLLPVEHDESVAQHPEVERVSPVTTGRDGRAWNGVLGDWPIPVEIAVTPRMRRFTDIWVGEFRRQLDLPQEAA